MELAVVSSNVSMKTLDKNPKVEKNKARKPVKELWPKVKRRIIAQATAGILRKNAAVLRLMRRKASFTLVVCAPNKAKKVAEKAATVVAAIDMSTVSRSLFMMDGRRVRDCSFG